MSLVSLPEVQVAARELSGCYPSKGKASYGGREKGWPAKASEIEGGLQEAERGIYADRVIMTNREFAKTNMEFGEACKRVKLKPTTRQASKWRRKKGLAWKKQTEL